MKKLFSVLGAVGIASAGAFAVASPSQALSDSWSTSKYVSLSTVASGACGYLYHSGNISYPLIGRTTVNGLGQINTYNCSTRSGKSISRTEQQNVFKWYGPSVTSCSVGGGGGSCSLGIGVVTWKGAALGGTASNYTSRFTIYGGTFAVRINHTTNGYWRQSTRDYSNSISSSRWL